jgi:hypothetical protein
VSSLQRQRLKVTKKRNVYKPLKIIYFLALSNMRSKEKKHRNGRKEIKGKTGHKVTA